MSTNSTEIFLICSFRRIRRRFKPEQVRVKQVVAATVLWPTAFVDLVYMWLKPSFVLEKAYNSAVRVQIKYKASIPNITINEALKHKFRFGFTLKPDLFDEENPVTYPMTHLSILN